MEYEDIKKYNPISNQNYTFNGIKLNKEIILTLNNANKICFDKVSHYNYMQKIPKNNWEEYKGCIYKKKNENNIINLIKLNYKCSNKIAIEYFELLKNNNDFIKKLKIKWGVN